MLDEFLNDISLYQKRPIELLRQNQLDMVWQKPDHFHFLSGSDVDIWCARLDLSLMQDLTGILSTYEKKRSQQLQFDRDKQRHVFSRGILRLILSKYVQESPNQIEIVIGPHGKPALSQRGGEYSIHFNLSHSHDCVLYSITRVGEIGVDVEKIREVPDMEKIVEKFFSAREKASFKGLAPSQKKQAFFNCWSRKEAMIKAMGGGLSLPLDQFDVSILPNQPAALLDIHWDPLEVHHWLLSDIWLDANHAAAMAVNISSMGRHGEI
jgi:4'-phosphopantetheinyl transferase